MLKIIMLIAFLTASIYNFRLGLSNKIRIKIKATFLIIIGAYSILILIMAWKKDGSLFGFILALSTIILLISNILSRGVRKDGFVVMNGASPLLLLIKIRDVKGISLEDNKAGIKLTIKVWGTYFVEYFKKKDMKKLEEFIAELQKK